MSTRAFYVRCMFQPNGLSEPRRVPCTPEDELMQLQDYFESWFTLEGAEGMSPEDYEALQAEWVALELTATRCPRIYEHLGPPARS